MATKLEVFLRRLSDFELSSFYKYRFGEFMPSSQRRILDEMRMRGIELDTIENIILNQKPSSEELLMDFYCSRCFCKRQRTEEYDVWRVDFDRPYKAYKHLCQICGAELKDY